MDKNQLERIWRREGLNVPQKPKLRGQLWLNYGCLEIDPEVVRHGSRRFYRASEADQPAWKSALRSPCLLANHSKLRPIIDMKLILHLSPQRISGRLKIAHEASQQQLMLRLRS